MTIVSLMRCMFLSALVTVAACGRSEVAPNSSTMGSAEVSWSAPTATVDGSPLNDLAGYRIYYGTDPDNLRHQIDIADPSVRVWTVDGLTPGNWHFAVTAVRSGGNESEYSKIGSKTID